MTDQDRLIAGRYRLGEQVGVGAMGIVWRARDDRLRRTVAVKQLLLQPGLDERQAGEARLRAMREARIAARLQHPNVVIVYDVAEDDGQPWLIMEYVPSRSLAMVLRDSGPMSPWLVADVGAQAAAGLAAAHAVGVVHRDVKPGNVLLGDDGTVKITDFGISRARDDVVVTATGLVTGTPAYLAPEMAKGENPAPPSDVFALGSTLYAAVQGTPPFGLNDNPLALLHLVANGKVSPPSNGGPLTPILMRLLRTDPADRPTMREVYEDLAAVAAQHTVVAEPSVADGGVAWTKPVPPVARPATLIPEPRPDNLAAAALPHTRPVPIRKRRRPLRLATMIVVALLAIGGAVYVVERAGHHTPPLAGTSTTSVVTTSPTVPPTVVGTPSFGGMTDLVTRYYRLLPGDVHDAFQLLSVRLQAKTTFTAFRTFYATINEVAPDGFRQVGPNMITAVINFVTKRGAVTHEPYRFTIIARRGTLIIDNAVRTAGATSG
ncbi:MAG TPA: serine/threonine-protein kinase [Pseudonocardiaceae bacterium]|nr:serine/threonine-protein kinase [Pseudonocardiaceae bacterium]